MVKSRHYVGTRKVPLVLKVRLESKETGAGNANRDGDRQSCRRLVGWSSRVGRKLVHQDFLKALNETNSYQQQRRRREGSYKRGGRVRLEEAHYSPPYNVPGITCVYFNITALPSTPLVKVLVRWAKSKMLTDRLCNVIHITLSPPGTDRILRVDAQSTRGSNFWGSRSIFQILDMRKLTFLLKVISWWT